MKKHPRNARVVFDVLYGFIPITEWEEKIINTPFFQRLRWIRQLGFANYIFPCAEHTRFSHALGVMHSMEQMIQALGLAVSDQELFSKQCQSKNAMLHKSLRIAALLHDLGTFPFSHAIEFAYIRHGNDKRRTQKKKIKELPNNHEHLGSFIIKNTNFKDGITRVLDEYGIDPQLISKLIKGESQYLVANQLMHSDLDSDRMDYLMRDSYYTGIKYGQFDREYILANLETFNLGKDQMGFGVNENATHAVEDFLISRFNWYSQIVKNPGSAKFDIISSHLAKALLEKDLIHQFHDLLTMVENRDERFFWWHDGYFMNRCQETRYRKQLQNPHMTELSEMLLYRRAPKTIHHPLFEHKIMYQNSDAERKKRAKQIQEKVAEFNRVIKKSGNGKEWVLADVPEKDVVFTTGLSKLVKKRNTANLYLERDPIKIVKHSGKPKLLIEEENSLMKHLSGLNNFVPSVYCNDHAFRLLKQKKLI